MKIISQGYDDSLHLIDMVEATAVGKIDDGFVFSDNEYCLGTHYLSTLEKGLSGMLVDTIYRENMSLEYRMHEEDRLGFYFYITDKEVDIECYNKQNVVGLLNYNLSIIDFGLPAKYIIENGTEIYCICIFVKKELFKSYLNKEARLVLETQTSFDIDKKAIMHMDRMNNKSRNLINDFKKISYDNPMYDLFFKGLVYELISNFVEDLGEKKISTNNGINSDVKEILWTKLMLVNMVEDAFPGIDFLANEVSMSATKYKELFTKITGLSPGLFFSNNKLHRAKELLASSEFTINEIADKLNYYNVSYFSKCFKKEFGLYPKEYQSLF